MVGGSAARPGQPDRAVSSATASLDGLDAATGGLNPVAAARASLADEEVEREQRQKRRDRITVLLAIVVAIASAAVSVTVSGTRSEEVAAQLAPEIASGEVQEARQRRIEIGTERLGAANSQLIARRLPTVAFPGPEVPFEERGDLLLSSATFARLILILPDGVAEGIRADVREGRTPQTLPAVAPADLPAGDTVVDVTPGAPTLVQVPGSGGTTTSREPQRPGTQPPAAPRNPGPQPAPSPRNPGSRPAPAPQQPAPAPAPNRDRGLCLLGVVLCER